MTQLAMFGDGGEFDRLPLPDSAKPAKDKAKVKYAAATTRTQDCQDCERFVYEQLMAGEPSGLKIRKAKVQRTEGPDRTLLCHAHAAERRLLDGVL